MKAWGLFDLGEVGWFLVCFVFGRRMGRGYREGEEPLYISCRFSEGWF